ncbi:MAG: NADH-quinone oxidoreductase subunit H [Actinomycetota bacterium]|nr:NADH-quinone oxidoreductase subunit H [Actinomycetota bacterium]
MIAAVLQLAGVLLALLVPGTIQTLKARLQGRRGPSPLQPYRTLRRLWKKSSVVPEGAGVVYWLAPPLIAACMLVALAIVPVAGRAGDFGIGHDALALIGVLALARFAQAASAWDTGNGFSLMGVARDGTLAVFAEALLALTLLVAALPAHSTDLRAMVLAAAGMHIWQQAAHWCGAAAFVLVILVETGRQPVDNPDTHLELTMIHEGPLLEYAGRDLALLQWSAQARHWMVLLLGAELFAPHPASFVGALAALVATLAAECVALALIETAQAKMRTLRVPALLGLGCLVALAGIGTFIAGVAT